MPVKSQSLPQPLTSCTQTNDCVPVPLSVIEKAKAAADEVKVSRPLIAAQAAEIDALKASNTLLTQKVDLQQSIIDLRAQQLVEKDKVIDLGNQQKDILEKRVAKLEKSNSRLRKIGVVLGAAAGVMGYLLLH